MFTVALTIVQALGSLLSIPRIAATQPQREVLNNLVLNSLARHFGVSSDEGVDEEGTQNNNNYILRPHSDIVSSIPHKSSRKSQRISPSSYNLRNSKVLGVEDYSESVREEGSQNGMNNILYSLGNSIRFSTNSNTVARRSPKRRRTSRSSLPAVTLTCGIDQEESQADVNDLLNSPRNSRQGDTPGISDDTDSNSGEPSTDLVAPKRTPRHLSTPPRKSRQGDSPDDSNDTNTDSNIDDEGPSTDLVGSVRTPRHPWSQVLQMTSLSLDPIFQRYLTEYGPDPEKFLNDHGHLIHKFGSFSYETRGDAFMACYQYTHQLECRQTSDKVRWCFSMLNFYDVIQIAWPGCGRIGQSMVPEVVDHFGPILGPGKLDPEKTKKDLNDWFCLGCKLNFLCEQFGPGSFFFLAHMLSENLYVSMLTVSSFTESLTLLTA